MSVVAQLKAGFGKYPVGNSPSMIAYTRDQNIKQTYALLFIGGAVVGGIIVYKIMKGRDNDPPDTKTGFNLKSKPPKDKPEEEATNAKSTDDKSSNDSSEDTTMNKKTREQLYQEYLKKREQNNS